MERNKFIKNLLNDSYIDSVIELMNKVNRVDTVYYPKYTLDMKKQELNAPLDEREVISGLKNLFVESSNYYIRNNENYDIVDTIYLKHKGITLKLIYDGESFSCSLIHGKIDDNNPIIINYEDLKIKYQDEVKEKENTTEKAIQLVIDNTNDFYEKICYALSVDERFEILYELENKSCLNCTNTFCKVSYKDKNKVDEKGLPVGNDCLDWMNPIYIGKSKILQIKDIKKIK